MVISLNIPDALAEKVDFVAKKYYTSRTEIIRRALIEYTEKEIDNELTQETR
jgi:metal-responsive CopG/Arc/MetJ family transcriptional regulator